MKILKTFGIGATPSQATATPSGPAQQITVTDFTNRAYLRNFILTNQYIILTKGNVSAGISLSDLALAMDTLEPTLTWPPLISVQPQNATVPTGTQTQFTVTVTSEITVTYQWQVLTTTQGAVWTNLTNTPTYGGATSAVLIINDVTGLNGYQYRVVCTNGSGSTTSSSATLTVT